MYHSEDVTLDDGGDSEGALDGDGADELEEGKPKLAAIPALKNLQQGSMRESGKIKTKK